MNAPTRWIVTRAEDQSPLLEYLAELDRTEGTGSSAVQRAHAPVTGANP